MPLTDIAIRKATPKEKRYMIADDRGLYLEVLPTGKKSWRYRNRSDGKEQKFTIGTYPEISLHEARLKAEEFRKRVARGEPVIEVKKRDFQTIAEEWLTTRIVPIRAPLYVESIRKRLKKHILPNIGDKIVDEIIPRDVLSICRQMETAGNIETAHRIKQIIGQVVRYAIAIDEATTDPTYSLQGALRPRRAQHYATITDPNAVGDLVRNISAYPRPVLRIAIMFSMLTFVRPGEIRHAEWTEFDWDKKEWHIPAEKMKMNRPHVVPLSKQAIKILEELKPLTIWQRWLFPSARMDGRPMSDNGVRTALRSMGYSNEDITPHGFRAMASTILNENGFTPDIIERQLAHAEGNKIRAAYNHAEYMPERRTMMQWWADWLDEVANKK